MWILGGTGGRLVRVSSPTKCHKLSIEVLNWNECNSFPMVLVRNKFASWQNAYSELKIYVLPVSLVTDD